MTDPNAWLFSQFWLDVSIMLALMLAYKLQYAFLLHIKCNPQKKLKSVGLGTVLRVTMANAAMTYNEMPVLSMRPRGKTEAAFLSSKVQPGDKEMVQANDPTRSNV